LAGLVDTGGAATLAPAARLQAIEAEEILPPDEPAGQTDILLKRPRPR